MRKTIAILLAVSLLAAPTQADFLNTIANGISSAANSVSSGLSTAVNATSSGLTTATNAVGSGLNTAVNATGNALSTAANATSKWVNTATSDIKDAYNVSSGTISNWTTDVRNSLSPVGSQVSTAANQLGNNIENVTTGTYHGVVNYAENTTGNAAAPTTGTTTTDTTMGSSILTTLLANNTGYIQVANSLLVALGQNQSAGVESAIKSIINNTTGNATYPSTPINSTVALDLAESIVVAMLTAQNYSVSVTYNGQNNTVNASSVANVFIAGLQDGITPCAVNTSSTTNATSGSSGYFQAVANACCSLVSQTLTYTEALSQTNGVATTFEASLNNSQNLGQAPSLDLIRCINNSTSTT